MLALVSTVPSSSSRTKPTRFTSLSPALYSSTHSHFGSGDWGSYMISVIFKLIGRMTAIENVSTDVSLPAGSLTVKVKLSLVVRLSS